MCWPVPWSCRVLSIPRGVWTGRRCAGTSGSGTCGSWYGGSCWRWLRSAIGGGRHTGAPLHRRDHGTRSERQLRKPAHRGATAGCGPDGSGKAPARSSGRSSPGRWSSGGRARWPGALPGGRRGRLGPWWPIRPASSRPSAAGCSGLRTGFSARPPTPRTWCKTRLLRWNGADHAAIAAPGAWLAKVVTNLCLNLMSAARAQREAYVGPWLPEPVLTADGTLGPLERVQQRESVTLGLLVLLERLTPAERAVFVLREAFGYSHREIADILDLSEANSRQVHRRARLRLSDARPRFHPEPGQWRDLMERFLAATRDGDVPALERVLAAEVTAWADGGGKVVAGRRPVSCRLVVARYLTGAFGRFAAGLRLSRAEVNGEPAVLGWSGETLLGMTVLEISGGQVTALRTISNPDKLRFAARQAARLSHSGAVPGS